MNRSHDTEWLKHTIEVDKIAMRSLVGVTEEDGRSGRWDGKVARFQGIRVLRLLSMSELESLRVMTT